MEHRWADTKLGTHCRGQAEGTGSRGRPGGTRALMSTVAVWLGAHRAYGGQGRAAEEKSLADSPGLQVNLKKKHIRP